MGVISIILIGLIIGISLIYLRGYIKLSICNDFNITDILECAIKSNNLIYIK